MLSDYRPRSVRLSSCMSSKCDFYSGVMRTIAVFDDVFNANNIQIHDKQALFRTNQFGPKFELDFLNDHKEISFFDVNL